MRYASPTPSRAFLRVPPFVSHLRDVVTMQRLASPEVYAEPHQRCIDASCERSSCVQYRAALVRVLVDAGIRVVRT